MFRQRTKSTRGKNKHGRLGYSTELTGGLRNVIGERERPAVEWRNDSEQMWGGPDDDLGNEARPGDSS